MGNKDSRYLIGPTIEDVGDAIGACNWRCRLNGEKKEKIQKEVVKNNRRSKEGDKGFRKVIFNIFGLNLMCFCWLNKVKQYHYYLNLNVAPILVLGETSIDFHIKIEVCRIFDIF